MVDEHKVHENTTTNGHQRPVHVGSQKQLHYGDLIYLTCTRGGIDERVCYLSADGLTSDGIETLAELPRGEHAQDTLFRITFPLGYDVKNISQDGKMSRLASSMTLDIEKKALDARLVI